MSAERAVLGEEIYLASGSTHPQLALDTASALGIELGPVAHKTFKSGEVWSRYEESIRKKHVFIMQSMFKTAAASINDSVVETALMVDAAKRASASEITVVAPYLAYGRQDRKNLGRDPISSAWLINMLIGSGADRISTIDMHSQQSQGVTNEPFDHFISGKMIEKELRKIVSKNPEQYLVVAPDAGRLKANETFANHLGLEVIFIPKTRSKEDPSQLVRPDIVEDIDGRICIVIDDMVDSGGTLISAINSLIASGAENVIVATTHGIFSGDALERLEGTEGLSKLIVTDTIDQTRTKEILGDRVLVKSVAPLLARGIIAITNGESVSEIFDGDNYS